MKKQESKAEIFKALGDDTRLAILGYLRNGELCASELLAKLPIAQSTLSHHMKTLVESGIVKARRAGKMTYYSLDQDEIGAVVKFLTDTVKTPPPEAACKRSRGKAR